MTEWVRANGARIRAEGAALTAADRDRVAAKFRREIGGLYLFVAACIEARHPDAR